MMIQTKYSSAELADQSIRLVAWSMFAVTLIMGFTAIEYFLSESAAGLIDMAVKVLALCILGVMVLLFAIKLRSINSEQRKQFLAEDGFLQIAFQKAMAKSFMLSFAVLAPLQALDNLLLKPLGDIPVTIVIKVVLTLMLLIFSIAFLIFTRTGNDE